MGLGGRGREKKKKEQDERGEDSRGEKRVEKKREKERETDKKESARRRRDETASCTVHPADDGKKVFELVHGHGVLYVFEDRSKNLGRIGSPAADLCTRTRTCNTHTLDPFLLCTVQKKDNVSMGKQSKKKKAKITDFGCSIQGSNL